MSNQRGNHPYSDKKIISQTHIRPVTIHLPRRESAVGQRVGRSNASSGTMRDGITPTGTTANEKRHEIRNESRNPSVQHLE